MSALHFSCTLCGRCCHDHSLPLTLDEAIFWLEQGGNLAIFCEAMPWPVEPESENLKAAHHKRRSFPVSSGASRVRVTAILVGVISGACRNLDTDLKCRIYERRPLVCRIYPAEISPFIQLNTAAKACPVEAWTAGDVLLVDGRLADSAMQTLVERSRQIDRDDALQKGVLCSNLNIDVSAIADEGFVAHEPDRKSLLAALREARVSDPRVLNTERQWRLYSRRPETIETLGSQGMKTLSEKGPADAFVYLNAPRANS